MIERVLPTGIDLLSLHRLDAARYPLLLESVAGTGRADSSLSRWDLLLIADGDGLCLERDGIVRRLSGEAVEAEDFLVALDHDWQRESGSVEEVRQGLPFRGGWALFLSYELAASIEPVLRLPDAPGPLPVALALRCPAAVLRDRDTGACLAIAEPGHEALLDALARDIAATASLPALPAWRAPERIDEDEPSRFVDGVGRIHGYLRAGDVFQVNLSRAWRADFAEAPDPATLYARLRESNPAPFAGLLSYGDWSLASSSPERLVSVRSGVAETRPIAGTRPRFPGDDDAERMRELVGHPKERAEHVMLIDLERNDLGRVCVPGSVRVDELMTVESYAHVHHIVSNVSGRLREEVTPGAVIRAVFPGGTITGCPKVRCMQIIAELEGEGRSAYTGAFGYLNRDGDMDLNILIRSAWLRGKELQLRAGAGIVVDSDAERELQETRHKARGLLRALGVDA
ncbi:aminodeoxychorismate synthase component I [Arenimonas sp.]|uniref:aminodeoxychorismate synthase component I n=1 Tax=Arenimonas sp. TaxID=1872635 RepID=UPI0039E3D6A1